MRHGRYDIDEDSRRHGGFSNVYSATTDDGAHVIIKAALPRGGAGSHVVGLPPAKAYVDSADGFPQHRTMSTAEVDDVFAQEALTLRRLDGHGFPRLHDVIAIDDRPALVMDPAVGTPMNVATARAEDFVLLLHRLADLVPHGLVAHGDLKPEHVFFGDDATVTFIDPGFRSGNRRALTPEYNPRFADGVVGDVVAVAVMIYQRYAGELPSISRDPLAEQPSLADVSPAPRGAAVWVDKILMHDWSIRANPGPPPWATDHRAAASELGLALQNEHLPSPHKVPPRLHIRVMADYRCYPLWVRTDLQDVPDTTEPSDLPLSPSLAGRLDAWAQWFESWLNMSDPHDSREVSPSEAAAFEEEGRLLTTRLAAEMPSACVRYWNDMEPCKIAYPD